MTAAIVATVAEAVRFQIAATGFCLPYQAERSYADWEIELAADEDCPLVRVDLVAVSTKIRAQLFSRDTLRYFIPIDIAIRKRLGQDAQDDDTGRLQLTEPDKLALFTEQIHELFTPRRLEEFAGGTWQETEIIANPVHKHLREWRQWTSILRVTFAADKSLRTTDH